MRDLTPAFRDAIALGIAQAWTEASSEKLASELGRLANGRVDWDDAVPEQWSVICAKSPTDAKESLVGIVLMSAPLVLIQVDWSHRLRGLIGSLPCIFFDFADWEKADFCIDRSVILNHFGIAPNVEDIDYDALSAAELYWDTVS